MGGGGWGWGWGVGGGGGGIFSTSSCIVWFPNETSVYLQSVYFNDNLSSNQQSIHVNCQQVKLNGG